MGLNEQIQELEKRIEYLEEKIEQMENEPECWHVWQENSTIPACKLCGTIKP